MEGYRRSRWEVVVGKIRGGGPKKGDKDVMYKQRRSAYSRIMVKLSGVSLGAGAGVRVCGCGRGWRG